MRRAAVTACLPVVALAVSLALVLALGGCAGRTPAAPLSIQLADIQSHTIRLHLHHVMEIDAGTRPDRFTPEIADAQVVSVVERRDLTSGRFAPEIVPLRVGSTQVALIGANPTDSVGFRVVVTP